MRQTRRKFNRTALLAAAGCTSLVQQLLARANEASYTIKKGDTLGQIAQDHSVSVSSVKQANTITGDLIKVGQQLKIPNSSSRTAAFSNYKVQAGDTLGGIAHAEGISVSALRLNNAIKGDLIRVGQILKIPASKTSVSSRSSLDFIQKVRFETEKIAVRTSNWDTIVAHHSAIKYGNAAIYDKAHRRRGMQNGLAYHFIIGNGINSGDGEIEIGPRWAKQLLGGHVRSYKINLSAIGICMIGNFQETHPSQHQIAAFTQLVDWLTRDVLKKKIRFAGHKDIEKNLCPGKNFPLAAMHARYG